MVWVKLVSTSLITLIMIYMIYYSLVSIKAYRGNFNIAPHHKARTKFLVLIPAVNEEAVINIPVDDLKNQKYPKKLFDVYVIADHCTDKTAMIAKKHGAKVITTEMGLNVKRHGVGKSNTLDYGLHYLGLNEWNKYKYVVVIDSDNNVASNFLQRLNDYAVEFSEPEAIQVHLDSKQGHGFINKGLNLSFIRSNYFQQLPEGDLGCASLLGTGFATSTKKVINQVGGFRFHTLTEDAYEEMYIISHGGNVKFIPDTYVVNENYSKIKQASKGMTRWSRGCAQCCLYFFNYAITHCLVKPSFKNFHILCRISTLSKMTQLIIIWGFWIWHYIFGSAFSNLRVDWLIYPMWIQHFMLLLSIVMTLNIVVFENFYLLYPIYGCKRTIYLILNAYVFQLFYNMINLWAIITFSPIARIN
ncbi:hypothetical protein LDL72_05545 [Lactobacillus delbrueckii subsp. lactis DSM 20072]|uniref:glycosyltransferase family 2 protein n=3 Tax=Lactobacillus delbrueckii TaxID=1584 RepID=UPI0006EFD3AC|nr:glycosyltransferase family 2 protein [Lactobacillus delbrueckii]ASW11855.1 hypothetical protein LDL72_05545 [Lactobacillus delbrueckii subsp. lactis DSM 20072]KRK61791.1 group 2 glycosyl transferase [Lactobacillus delbrueckii subsp. lactis DSM 20072]OOV09817.1 hypothetical protein LL072_04875 [Lactobacillus delbrueckii subsp. lactis DSM 20072]